MRIEINRDVIKTAGGIQRSDKNHFHDIYFGQIWYCERNEFYRGNNRHR